MATKLETAMETESEEVTFDAGGRGIPGTITHPTAAGPWPAVLLIAGSGPTDRNWCSPLLPGKNGSGRLLAESLAGGGAVVVRFDKAASGKNLGPPLPQLTLDTYVEEAGAALAHLRARPDVRGDRIIVAGHSEGGIHATRLAAAHPDLAAIIYLCAAARSMAATILTQLEGNLRHGAQLEPDEVARQMATMRAAMDDFLGGAAIDPATVSPYPPVQQLFAGLTAPQTRTLTRALLGFDPAAAAAALAMPAHVLACGKDVQVDPALDAAVLVGAIRAAGKDVAYHLAPDADHVLKHEPRTQAALRADLHSVQVAYNAGDRALDPDALAAIAGWII